MEPTQQSTSLFQLNLDAQNGYTLRNAASWAKVLGIVGIMIGILCVVVGVIVQQTISDGGIRNETGFSATTLGNGGLIMYAAMGLIYILSSMFALTAGNKISRGLRTNDQASLNSGFAGIRNYFAFWTILMIIFLILLLITVLGALGNM